VGADSPDSCNTLGTICASLNYQTP
jgi:hypothetical protein